MRKTSLEVGSALVLFIIGVVSVSIIIVGGAYAYKNSQSGSSNKLPSSSKVEIKLSSTGTSLYCASEGVEEVKKADLVSSQVSADFEKCRKETGQFSGDCNTVCKNVSDQASENCNGKVDSNLISVDEFESCIKTASAGFKTCLDSCSQNPQSYLGNFKDCQQKSDDATKNFTTLINKYCSN